MNKYYKLVSILALLTPTQVLVANDATEIDEAEKIVKTFSSYEDNVDTFENYWLVAKAVANIDPVKTRRKVQFLIDVCKYYTPTDKAAASYLACDKIWYLGKKISPKSSSQELKSKDSPLFKIVED